MYQRSRPFQCGSASICRPPSHRLPQCRLPNSPQGQSGCRSGLSAHVKNQSTLFHRAVSSLSQLHIACFHASVKSSLISLFSSPTKSPILRGSPTACVHVMGHQRRVIAVDGAWGVEQNRQQVFLMFRISVVTRLIQSKTNSIR